MFSQEGDISGRKREEGENWNKEREVKERKISSTHFKFVFSGGSITTWWWMAPSTSHTKGLTTRSRASRTTRSHEKNIQATRARRRVTKSHEETIESHKVMNQYNQRPIQGTTNSQKEPKIDKLEPQRTKENHINNQRPISPQRELRVI